MLESELPVVPMPIAGLSITLTKTYESLKYSSSTEVLLLHRARQTWAAWVVSDFMDEELLLWARVINDQHRLAWKTCLEVRRVVGRGIDYASSTSPSTGLAAMCRVGL